MGWIKKRAAFVLASEHRAASTGLRYKLGIISDAHSGYTNGTAHLAAALKNLHDLGAQEIVSCGDSAVNGTVGEWQDYVNVIEASPYSRAQVHECNGNHDGVAPQLTTFKQYSNNGALSGGNPYFAIDLFGDRFIFMALDKAITPNTAECFSDAQMTWLEGELAEHYNKNKNVWIVVHALFQKWGSGDNPSKPGYTGGLNDSYTNHDRLKQLLIQYSNCIILHGHSHIQLEDRDRDDGKYGLVVYAPPGENSGGCHNIHVPSVTAQKFFSAPGSLQVQWDLGESQCWLCEVYSNKIVFRGIYAYTKQEVPNMVITIER